jgi:hypothetical protein
MHERYGPTERHGDDAMSEGATQQERSNAPDSSSGRLQVLATEHWSLLATRSLNYTEAFSRVGMFLSILSGAVIALALLAQVDHFHKTFLVAGVAALSVVVFVGIATVGRLGALNRENMRWVMGMNRLRRAYLETYPDLEPYFVSGSRDDLRGILMTMDVKIPLAERRSRLAIAAQGFQTLPGMLAVVVAAVAGALVAMLVALFGGSRLISGVLAAVAFLTTNLVLGILAKRAFVAFSRTFPPRFSSADEPPGR